MKDTISKSFTTVSNDTSIIETLDSVCEKSMRLMERGAYLHWFQKYVGQDIKCIMRECCQDLEACSDMYKGFL